MVQDSRVSRQLARLGGVYRDPARVNRDASSLLKSSVGTHLQPIAAMHVDDTGSNYTVLVLQGTISIHFRGATYQLLIDMYLVPKYPLRPPIVYVRLAPQMYLKENHRHVGKDGKVYLPYLHEWKAHSHNLVELTVAMSSVFSADPPVFSKPGGGAASSQTTAALPQATAATTTSSTSNYSSSTSNEPPPFSQALNPNAFAAASSSSSNNNTTTSSWRDQQAQLEAMMAKEAAEANAAAQVAREAEQAEQRRKQAQEQAVQSLKTQVLQKVHSYCRSQEQATMDILTEDAKDEQGLKLYPISRIQQQLRDLTEKQTELQEHCRTVDEKTVEIQEWIDEQENAMQTSADNQPSIDDLCVADSPLHHQSLELAAENASLGDVLYFLDRALFSHQISVDHHLKQVRSIAKQQFLVRAHLVKIQQHVAATKL